MSVKRLNTHPKRYLIDEAADNSTATSYIESMIFMHHKDHSFVLTFFENHAAILHDTKTMTKL
jgi:hypothetical protein